MCLFTFPPEVVRSTMKMKTDGNLQHCLFPFLRWNDLLRLRRVSKASKLLVQNYVKANPKLSPEIEISGTKTERNLKAFLDLELASTKIYLNNEGSKSGFYQDISGELTRFLDLYGSVVTHLRVDYFSLHVTGMELTFLEGLTNLQSIEAEWFDTAKHLSVQLPEVLRNLTVLKLKFYGNGEKMGKYEYHGLKGFTELLNNCKMLETLSLPSNFIDHYSLATDLFGYLDTAIQQRETNPENATLSKLKVIDFDFIGSCATNTYRQFLGSCAKHGILLRGVNADRNECLKELARNIGNLKMPLQSLSQMIDKPYNWAWLLEREMPFLERIKLHTSTWWRTQNNRIVCGSANWPMLKCLELDVQVWDSDKRNANSDMILQETRELFRLFFEGICHTELLELSVGFAGRVGNNILTAGHLTSSCSSLKKLELNNWGGNNKQFVGLWEGLSNLEEVVLENCSSLGDEGFIGPDVEKPVFLNLKKLRKLTLQSLSWMPGITDHLFIMVIRHLSLTQFTITSADPLKNVTRMGIESLLGGRFNECIEKFSFRGWTLHPATPRQNGYLQKLFAHRLSNMV